MLDVKDVWSQLAFLLAIVYGVAESRVFMPYHEQQADLPNTSLQTNHHSCSEHAERGHCIFYSCLDTEFACGNRIHNSSLGRRFCDVTRHHEAEFETPQGAEWARQTSQCMTQTLSSLAETEHDTWCSRADILVGATFESCAQQYDICQVLWPERRMIQHIFRSWSWLKVVQAAQYCPPTVINRYIRWMTSERTRPES